MLELEKIISNLKNFVFIGETGSGKSEIALNFAKAIKKITNKEVHLFDLDMTKPLFRSRAFKNSLENYGIKVRYSEQHQDAPTTSGGVRWALKNPDIIAILDVGGDYIGARSIGGYASIINKDTTAVYYVLNGFRVWSNDIARINHTFSQIIAASHINPEKIKVINNPNYGPSTKLTDYQVKHASVEGMVSPYKEVAFSCINESLYYQLDAAKRTNVFPLYLHINLKVIS